MADADGPVTLMLELHGPKKSPVEVSLSLNGRVAASARLDADAIRWIAIDLSADEVGRPVMIRLDTLKLDAGPAETGVGLAGLVLLDPAEDCYTRFFQAVAIGSLPDNAAFRPETS